MLVYEGVVDIYRVADQKSKNQRKMKQSIMGSHKSNLRKINF